MTDLVPAAAALALAAAPACLALRAFDREGTLGRTERLGLGYGLGLGLLTWWMTLLCLFRVRLSLPLILAPSLAATIALVTRAALGRSPRAPTDARSEPLRSLDVALLAGISLAVGRTFLQALLTPMEGYDAVAIWGLKAKAIFLERALPVGLLQDGAFALSHPDYPLLVPLAESYIAITLGRWNDVAVKLIFPLFLVALLVLFHAALGRLTVAGPSGATSLLTRRQRLLITLLLASVPALSEQAASGYADIAIAFFSGLGTIYLYLWLRGGAGFLLGIAAFLTALGATAKNEGKLLALINLALLAAGVCRRGVPHEPRRRRLVSVTSFAAALLLISSPWSIERHVLGLSNDVVNMSTLTAALHWDRAGHIVPILRGFLHEACKVKSWNLAWPLFLAAAGLRVTRPGREGPIILIAAVFLPLAGYAAIYLITPYDVVWHMGRSVNRLLLHLLPVVVFAVAGLHREERA